MARHGSPSSRLRLASAVAVLCAVAGCAAGAFASVEGPSTTATCMSGFDVLPGPVRWHRTGSAEDALVMDAWCEAVGPAVVAGPVGAEGNGDGPPLESLAVVTWNVHVGGGDVVRLVNDLRQGVFTGGTPVKDFVLLLQEAHRAGGSVPTVARQGAYPPRILVSPPEGERLDILAIAQRLGLYVLYVPSMRNGLSEPAEDRGNAILSTVPLGETGAIELPYEAQRRVAVAATIQVRDGNDSPWSLRLVSAHLDNRSRLTRIMDSFGRGRARQAKALSEVIAEPVAVVGADLNTWSVGFTESAVDLLMASFQDTPPAPEPTYHGRLSRKLDHLLVRLPDGWSATVRRAGTPYGSDHYPLIGIVHREQPAT
jgi:endonuclease/exonuclease/phosphatase family metal-dependent hydrolase